MSRPTLPQPNNILDHDSYIESTLGIPSKLVTTAGIDFPAAFIEETIGNVTFRGETLTPYNPKDRTGSPEWLLSKTTVTGGTTVKEFASSKYDQVWDSRHTAFSLPTATDFRNDRAMLFDGISDCVAFPERMYRSLQEKWSISFWFKPRILSNQTIFSRIETNFFSGRQVSMTSAGSLKIECLTKSPLNKLVLISKTGVDGQHIFRADKWHHIMIAIDGGSTSSDTDVYVNGTLWSDWDVESDTVDGTGNFQPYAIAYFGKSILNPTHYLDGLLDEVVFSDSKYDDVNAMWLYNGGVPVDVYELNQQSGLDVRYWFRMGDGIGDYFPYCTASICYDSSESPPDSLRGAMRNMSQDNYSPEVV